jgi:hypothetical protein
VAAAACGSSRNPDSVTVTPNPNPEVAGVWRNAGRNAKLAYIPKPMSSATRFVVHTPRIRIMPMSISGCADRASRRIHTAATSSAKPNRPRVAGEVHPHAGARVTPSSRATSQLVSSAAATQLTRPPARTVDSGTAIQAPPAAATFMIIGSQNSQW